MKLLFLDTETTSNKNPRIIEFAYRRVNVQDMALENAKAFRCRPPVPIDLGAMSTHHITEEMVKGEEEFSAFAAPVQSLINVCVSVAHNADFDIGALRNEGIEIPEGTPFICTYKVAAQLFPDLEQHKLQYLRYALKADKPEFHSLEAHNAMNDVIILEAVFYALLWHMIETNPAKTLTEQDIPNAIQKMIEMSTGPLLLPKLAFGKHKGKTFAQVKLEDTGYLEWLHNAEKDKPAGERNENLLHTIRHHLKIKSK